MKWFDSEGRKITLSIFNVISTVFNVVGMFVPEFFFSGYEGNELVDVERSSVSLEII